MLEHLRTKLGKGELAIGASVKADPRLAMILANAGIDFFQTDMMFSPLDWQAAQTVTWICNAKGIASILRIPANPWLSPDDPHLVIDAGRAYSIGFDAVVFSCSSAAELEHVMMTTKDWHRVASGIFRTSAQEVKDFMGRVQEETLLIPLVECDTALNDLEGIFAVDNLKVVWLGATDIARVLGHPHEYEHPDVWRVIDKAVNLGNKRGVTVYVNGGYIYTDFTAITQAMKRLYDHGVRMMNFSGDFVLQTMSRNIISEVRKITS
jgi:2-keto-3-deoxy-L-rhamnonate aldolase RhmA